MNRSERIARQLIMSRRVAQPTEEDDRSGRDDIRPPMTDVDTGNFHDYPSDDREDQDTDPGSNVLFGGPDEEFIPPDDDHDTGGDNLRKSRIKLLAGMIWAQLGEPDAVVEESAPNELSIRVQDLSWKMSINDDGRVTLSGFDSGAEQYIGEIPDEDAEQQIVKISDHVHELIAQDIEEKSVPVEPPVHFGPEEPVGQEGFADQGAAPPAAPGGDQGAAGMPMDQAIPPDMGAPMPPDQGMGMPPAPGGAAPPAGGMPPAGGGFPPPGGQQGGFPMASRSSLRRQMSFRGDNQGNPLSIRPVVRRVASSHLENVSTQLYRIGQALGDEGEETFTKLADRVQKVVDAITQSNT